MSICIWEAKKSVAQFRAIAGLFFLLNTNSVAIIAQRHLAAIKSLSWASRTQKWQTVFP
jgi:hypothetical protein